MQKFKEGDKIMFINVLYRAYVPNPDCVEIIKVENGKYWFKGKDGEEYFTRLEGNMVLLTKLHKALL